MRTEKASPTYLNGKFTSGVYSTATYTEFNGVNSLGDLTADTISGRINGFPGGPRISAEVPAGDALEP
jgi:hypothetical protein